MADFCLFQVINVETGKAEGRFAVPPGDIALHQMDRQPTKVPYTAFIHIKNGPSHVVKLPFEITQDPVVVSDWVNNTHVRSQEDSTEPAS